MKHQLIYIAAVLLALTACSSEEANDNGGQQEGIPIMLRAGVSNVTRASSSIQTSQFDKGSVINVYIKEITTGGQSATTKYSPFTYTTTNASGALSPQNNAYPYFPTNGRGVTILGMYPSLVNNATNDFQVQQDQRTDEYYKKSDLMVATDTIETPNSNMRTLQFKHLLSKITIQVVAGTGSPDIEGSSVTLYNVYRDIYFDGQTGALGTVHGSTRTYIDVTDDCSEPKSCIIPPQELDPCRFFRIRLASTDVIYYYNPQTLTFEGGHEYKFTITVNQNNLEVSYTVGTWTDLPEGANVYNKHADLETE